MPPVDAQAPMEIAHLGCGICCQMRRRTGASLKGTRPAQISTSAWRGEKLMRSIPKRARSYLDAAVAMNSIAQQAVQIGRASCRERGWMAARAGAVERKQ